MLREIVLECGLIEESKWGVPCYTINNKNVLIVSAFNNFCSINFVKGSLIKDSKNILKKNGKNTQAARAIKFANLTEIKEIETEIKTFVKEAIEIEKKGLKVTFKKNPEPVPIELTNKFEEDNNLKIAFEKLTPGRQREYIIHFSGAKQSKTRESRIEKCIEKIMNIEGLNDNYKSKKS